MKERLSPERMPTLQEEVERSKTLDDIVQAVMHGGNGPESQLPIGIDDNISPITCNEAAGLVSAVREWVRSGKPTDQENPMQTLADRLPRYLVRRIEAVVDVDPEESAKNVGFWKSPEEKQ